MKFHTPNLFLVMLIILILGMVSYRVTYALFSSSATSGNNAFSTASDFSPVTPPQEITPTPTSTPSSTPSVSPSPTFSPSQSASSSPTPIPVVDLQINEFMAHPNSGNEWVEIINMGNTTINLTGWVIFDGNNSRGDDLSLSGTITAGQILAFNHSSGWLNDAGDKLNLENNLGATLSATTYASSTIDKSIGHAADGVGAFKTCTTVTKGTTNNGFC